MALEKVFIISSYGDSTSNVHCNVSAIPRSHLNYTCLDVMLVDKLAGTGTQKKKICSVNDKKDLKK